MSNLLKKKTTIATLTPVVYMTLTTHALQTIAVRTKWYENSSESID